MFVSDFSDTGECHHTRNTRKHTGRIFKITYGKPEPWKGDIGKLKNIELAKLQLHDNDWFVRHARRVLHERLDYSRKIWSPFSPDLEKNHAAWRGHRANWFHEVDAALKIQLSGHESVPKRLRALWALYVSEGIEAADLIDLLRDSRSCTGTPPSRLWRPTQNRLFNSWSPARFPSSANSSPAEWP